MHIANAHEGRDVRLMRLSGERVAKKNDKVELAKGCFGPDLLIAAHGSGEDAVDGELGGHGHAPSGGAGAAKLALGKEGRPCATKFFHGILAPIMGDKGDAWAARQGGLARWRVVGHG
jgi:hypothetical protein